MERTGRGPKAGVTGGVSLRGRGGHRVTGERGGAKSTGLRDARAVGQRAEAPPDRAHDINRAK